MLGNLSMSQPPSSSDNRLTELEIKLSYAEDLAETLNEIVTRQQAQIDWLMREVQELRRRRDEDGLPGFRSLRDELPPHY